MSQLRLLSGSKPVQKIADTPSCQCTPSNLSLRDSGNNLSKMWLKDSVHSAFSPTNLKKLNGKQHVSKHGFGRESNTPGINAYNPISVAKYLSPTRSHVSQHVKPLFANRKERLLR